MTVNFTFGHEILRDYRDVSVGLLITGDDYPVVFYDRVNKTTAIEDIVQKCSVKVLSSDCTIPTGYRLNHYRPIEDGDYIDITFN